MSFSENQTDHYLDDFINGKNPQSDLPEIGRAHV